MKSNIKNAENQERISLITDLTAQVKSLVEQVHSLTDENKYLAEQNALLRQWLFGRKSEQKIVVADDVQLRLFNEAETECDETVSETEIEQITYKRKKSKGKREMDFSGLPTEQIVHELPENECVCPDCGGMLHTCGHDVLRRELTVIPAQYIVTEHIQTVYSCRECEKNSIETPMLKSEVPAPLIKGSGVASPSLVAHIANQKYCLALPLYRQEQEFSRNNLNLSRQTMANWLIYVSEHWLMPIFLMLKSLIVSSEVLHADETTVQVLKEKDKKPESKSYMWLYRTGSDAIHPIVLYEYKPNRKHENAKQFLCGFNGYLHSDGYQAYGNLSSDVTVVGCWAHVRRKFADILKSIPDYNKPGSLAMRAVKYCDELFDLEREYAKLSSDSYFKLRYEARLEQSKPVMDEFFEWVESVYGKNIMATKQSNMGKALAYALNQKSHLENVLLDGRLELSNNHAERSIKPFVIGRKNWIFSISESGATTSSVFYSIIETAKENNLKPYEYLKYIFETAPNIKLSDNSDSIQKLLPWNAPSECRNPLQIALPIAINENCN